MGWLIVVCSNLFLYIHRGVDSLLHPFQTPMFRLIYVVKEPGFYFVTKITLHSNNVKKEDYKLPMFECIGLPVKLWFCKCSRISPFCLVSLPCIRYTQKLSTYLRLNRYSLPSDFVDLDFKVANIKVRCDTLVPRSANHHSLLFCCEKNRH
jgi:hypothetical protein